MPEPIVQQLPLPPVYGKPNKKLEWGAVRKDLEEAPVYWVATTRPDGRPHVVPRDGLWLDDAWYYGGASETVHNQNVEKNAAAVMHVGDGMKAIIVEGRVERAAPSVEVAQKLADMNNVKYAHYGMTSTAETYTSGETLALVAHRVLAWTLLFEDATRFVFPRS